MTKNIVETFPSVEEENNSMITSSTSPDEKLSLIVNGTDESCSSFPSTKELQHTIAEDSIPQDDNSESVLEESSVSAKLDSGSYPSYSAQKSSSPTAVEAPPFTIDKSVLPQNPVSQNPVSVPQKSDLSGVYSFHPEHAVTFTTTDEMLMSLPLGSRLFLGRLATEKTDRNELASIFAKYGPIHEISLKNTFGFIQFATAEACQAAILHEQGRVIGGLSVGMSLFIKT
jgi:RNA recognition motif-containing protein